MSDNDPERQERVPADADEVADAREQADRLDEHASDPPPPPESRPTRDDR